MGNKSVSDSESFQGFGLVCFGAADNIIPNKLNYNPSPKNTFIPTKSFSPQKTFTPKVNQNSYHHINNNSYNKTSYNNTNKTTYQKSQNNDYIDKSLIKFDDINRIPLYINLIHYDENLTNEENEIYYKFFKLNIVGGYYGIDLYNLFTSYIDAINNSKVFLRYILIVTGSNAIDIMKCCYNYKYIDEIIIFCNYPKNYSYLKSFDKIKLISNSFVDIVNYLRTKTYTNRELDMNNQLPVTPLITFCEYENCYFAIHRMLSRFFKADWSNPYITFDDVICVAKFLDRSSFPDNTKYNIYNIMKNLLYSKNFAYDCIKYYTGEDLCYVFNKTLRDIGKNFDGMAHFIGPFNYALYKYLYDHPNKGIYQDTILYRDVEMSIFDLYLYQLSLYDVICFPSFTSTTILKNLNFKSTSNSNTINKSAFKKYPVKMIFSYHYIHGNIPPGILIDKESLVPGEKEVLLFPFTFVKITKLEYLKSQIVIYFDIINRDKIIEFELKKGYKIGLCEKNNKLFIK